MDKLKTSLALRRDLNLSKDMLDSGGQTFGVYIMYIVVFRSPESSCFFITVFFLNHALSTERDLVEALFSRRFEKVTEADL